ncbi:MAG: hypothetical protein AAFY59_01890 [Pseudomonadota bacterium]
MAYVSTQGAPCAARRTSFFLRVLNALLAADAGYRQKQSLRSMTRAQLEDIGLTEDDVAQFTPRPHWDAPQMMLR